MRTSAKPQTVLVVNAGASSIKFALFDHALAAGLAGSAEGIGGAGVLRVGTRRQDMPLPDHASALDAILVALGREGIGLSSVDAVAHRVVHGGARLTRPVRVTADVHDEIRACVPLAPLHNPLSLSAIDAVAARAPGLPQYASFDTAFHATIPEVARRYAIPARFAERGIRRYGFHGLSYQGLVRNLPRQSGQAVPHRLLACHLGAGASLCAIVDGRSVATTMGYSPLEGLTMATRSGCIDANAVLRLAEEFGIEPTRRLLNNESGLVGLSGQSGDMRALLDDAGPESAFAVAHFGYWAVRHAGSLIAAMGGCDAIAFTGGIGENAAPVRRMILDALTWLGLRVDIERNNANAARLHAAGSSVTAWVVPAEEERTIAADALSLMAVPA